MKRHNVHYSIKVVSRSSTWVQHTPSSSTAESLRRYNLSQALDKVNVLGGMITQGKFYGRFNPKSLFVLLKTLRIASLTGKNIHLSPELSSSQVIEEIFSLPRCFLVLRVCASEQNIQLPKPASQLYAAILMRTKNSDRG